MKDESLTKKIIGAAFRVHNALGFGFLESVYENSLLIELGKEGVKAESQRPVNVYYEGQTVGKFVVDILVEDQIVLELKSVRQLATAHEVQLVNYLCATGMDIGLLLNFGPNKVDVKRKVRQLEPHSNDPD